MSLAAVRAAIVDRLESVEGIGLVHDRERYARSIDQLKALYVADGVLLGWYVRRVASEETRVATGRHHETTRWRITGLAGFDDDDASETALDTLVEAVRDAFRADPTLDGTVASTATDRAAGLQLVDHEPVLFAGVLCHRVRLDLFTRRYLNA